jgi:hypothetical protein
MLTGMSDSIRWTHQGGGGSTSITVDFEAQTITRRKEAPRPLSAESLAQLRALAEAVEPEHTRLQPSHLTYAQDQMMFITLGEKHVTIDASSGEISEGPPSTLLDAMVALLRTP